MRTNAPPLDKTARIEAILALIPPGRVVSYGQVADLAGLPGRARLVGKVLRETPIAVANGPSIHDCALTRNYVVVLDLPVTLSMKALMVPAAAIMTSTAASSHTTCIRNDRDQPRRVGAIHRRRMPAGSARPYRCRPAPARR